MEHTERFVPLEIMPHLFCCIQSTVLSCSLVHEADGGTRFDIEFGTTNENRNTVPNKETVTGEYYIDSDMSIRSTLISSLKVIRGATQVFVGDFSCYKMVKKHRNFAHIINGLAAVESKFDEMYGAAHHYMSKLVDIASKLSSENHKLQDCHASISNVASSFTSALESAKPGKAKTPTSSKNATINSSFFNDVTDAEFDYEASNSLIRFIYERVARHLNKSVPGPITAEVCPGSFYTTFMLEDVGIDICGDTMQTELAACTDAMIKVLEFAEKYGNIKIEDLTFHLLQSMNAEKKTYSTEIVILKRRGCIIKNMIRTCHRNFESILASAIMTEGNPHIALDKASIAGSIADTMHRERISFESYFKELVQIADYLETPQ